MADEPVHVTGEERPHPAYRLLARAMLALARLKGNREPADRPTSELDDQGKEAGNG